LSQSQKNCPFLGSKKLKTAQKSSKQLKKAQISSKKLKTAQKSSKSLSLPTPEILRQSSMQTAGCTQTSGRTAAKAGYL
jgi:hypothetical protein